VKLDDLIAAPQFSLSQKQKDAALLSGLNALTQLHHSRCANYARILDALGHEAGAPAETIEDVPFLPVSLFKTHYIKSVPDEAVTTVMTSSGTTGQAVSRIALDAETAALQARALVNVITTVTGKQRLPMLIVDAKKTIQDPHLLSARGAGIVGLMRFGRNHTFLLDDDMRPVREALETFLREYGGAPFIIFGFTFMVWQYLQELVREGSFDLSHGVLIHSGGWKKLTEMAVDNATFRNHFAQVAGLRRIYNFYGMVEQMGAIFLEGEDGLLYPPNFADVIIRDPFTLVPLGSGEPGLLEVVCLLPRSYPGHAVLTEDIGVIRSVDGAGGRRLGCGIEVIGRAPKSELRGCSDTHAYRMAQAT